MSDTDFDASSNSGATLRGFLEQLAGRTIALATQDDSDGRCNDVVRLEFTDGSVARLEYDWMYSATLTRKKAAVMTERTIVQQAIINGGYGTSGWDADGECYYESWADVEVEIGSMDWWITEYDADDGGHVEYKSCKLFEDFGGIPCDFTSYRARVWSDGERDYAELERTCSPR